MKKAMKKQKIVRLTLRLPKNLRDAIRKESRLRSDKNDIDVSMNQIIIEALEAKYKEVK